MLVLLHHTGLIAGGAAGAAGVTTFFVLSGFLITSVLEHGWTRDGRIAFGDFYRRRARRLLPALLVVLGTVAALSAVLGAPAEGAMTSLVAGSYLTNWFLATGHWIGPLSHTWSLAIEGQFYVVWPIALAWVMGRFRFISIIATVVGVAAVITVARTLAVFSGWTLDRISFGTDLQADGLLIGSALALVGGRLFHARLLMPAGMVLVLIAALAPLNPTTWTVAIIGATLLISGRHVPDRFVAPILRSRALGATGRISYGLYLWHYPVLWQLSVLGAPDLVATAGALALTFAAAIASSRWVERPWLTGPYRAVMTSTA